MSIEVDGRIAGIASLTNITREASAIFHCHIFDDRFRGCGVGRVAYVEACKIFFERFSLQEIVFQTPVINAAANKLKASIQLKPLGKIVIGTPLRPHLISGLEAYVYRLKKVDLKNFVHLSKDQ